MRVDSRPKALDAFAVSVAFQTRVLDIEDRRLDWNHAFPAATIALFANTLTISRRYSGVSIDVASGVAACTANSPTTWA